MYVVIAKIPVKKFDDAFDVVDAIIWKADAFLGRCKTGIFAFDIPTA